VVKLVQWKVTHDGNAVDLRSWDTKQLSFSVELEPIPIVQRYQYTVVVNVLSVFLYNILYRKSRAVKLFLRAQ